MNIDELIGKRVKARVVIYTEVEGTLEDNGDGTVSIATGMLGRDHEKIKRGPFMPHNFTSLTEVSR